MKKLIFILSLHLAFFISANAQNIKLNDGGKTYAVVIGISDYQDEKIDDLNYAHKDAKAFAAWLQTKAAGEVSEDNIKILINENATSGRLVEAFGWLTEHCKQGDRAIIYFSGHGDADTKYFGQPGYLLTWDTPSQTYMTNAFSVANLQIIIATLSVNNKSKVILVTDACRSGNLAGKTIGGPQYTNSNLAEISDRAINILSCQSNESSVEGEEWGGGHGAFTWNLIDGLYGNADADKDLNINLKEIGRYLEDNVTPQVAPIPQTPMFGGNKSESISIVNKELFGRWQKEKGNQQQFFKIDQKGLVEETLANVDSTIKELYYAFATAVDDGVFLDPADSCADAYYRRLIDIPELKPLYGAMTRNFAAALQDDAQQAINGWLRSDPNEIESYMTPRGIEYLKFPPYLDRAAELLGKDHYMYNDLKAKKSFFQARGLIMKNGDMLTGNWDSLSLAELYSYVEEGLSYNDQAPYLYAKLAYYYIGIGDWDKTHINFRKAYKFAPNWIWVTIRVGNGFRRKGNFKKATEFYEKAISIDSTNISSYDILMRCYSSLIDFEVVLQTYEKLLKLDSNYYDQSLFLDLYILETHDFKKYKEYCERKSRSILRQEYLTYGDTSKLILTFNYSNELNKSELLYKEVFQTFKAFENSQSLEKSNQSLQYYNNRYLDYKLIRELGFFYFLKGQYPEAEKYLLQVLTIDSTHAEAGRAYMGLALIAYNKGQLKIADYFLEKAFNDKYISPYVLFDGLYLYGMYQRTEEAIFLFEKASQKYPTEPTFYYHLGKIFMDGQKDYPKSIVAFEKLLELISDNGFLYYECSRAYALDGDTSNALSNLSIALQKGYDNYEKIQTDPAFNALRDSKQFKKLMQPYFEK